MAITLTTSDYNKAIGTQTDSVIRANSTLWNTYSDFHYVVDIYPIGFTFYGGNQLRFFVKPNPNTGLMLFNLSKALKNVVVPMGVNYANMTTSYIYADSVGGARVQVAVSEYYNGAIQSTSSTQQFSIIYSAYDKEVKLFAFPDIMAMSGYDTIGNKYFNIGHNMYWRNIRRYATTIETIAYSIRIKNGSTTLFLLNNTNSGKSMSASVGSNYPSAIISLDNNFVTDNSTPATTLGTLMNTGFQNGNYIEINESVGTNTRTNAVLNVINECVFDSGVMLYFVNEYGQWEHFYFPHWKETTNKNTKGTIKLPKYDSAGNTAFAFEFERDVVNTTESNLLIKTDLLSEDIDYQLLKRVLTSPVLYMNFVSETSNTLYKVVLNDGNYNTFKQQYDRLKQIQFNIKIARQINL